MSVAFATLQIYKKIFRTQKIKFAFLSACSYVPALRVDTFASEWQINLLFSRLARIFRCLTFKIF